MVVTLKIVKSRGIGIQNKVTKEHKVQRTEASGVSGISTQKEVSRKRDVGHGTSQVARAPQR